MNDNNRHFATYTPTKDEVVVMGYREKTNEVLVAFLSRMPQSEAQDLRRVVLSAEAQKKDFLMDVVGGSVLASAHHPAGKDDWQTHLLSQGAAGQNSAVRKVTMKDLVFYDASQKAYLAGYGESIEPETDALRKARIQHQNAVLTGQPLPTPETVLLKGVTSAPTAKDQEQSALITTLGVIAETQAAILAQLASMEKPAARKPAARKPAAKKPKRAYTKKTQKVAPEPASFEVDVSSETDLNSEIDASSEIIL